VAGTASKQVNGEDISSMVDRLAGMYGFVQNTLIFKILLVFLFNKTNRRTNFQIYFGTQLYMFRAASLPSIRSYLLYIWHWHILYRFDDRLQVVVKPV